MIRRARVLCWLMFCASLAVHAGKLRHVALEQQGNKTTLFLTIDGAFKHKIFTLTNPQRVVIDLAGTQLQTTLTPLKSTLIQDIRSGHPVAGTLRLVLHVSQKVQMSSSPWHSKGIRIDLIGSTTPPKPSPAKKAKSEGTLKPIISTTTKAPLLPPPPQKPQTVPNKAANIAPRVLRDVIIVLDAGHGGKDPGARGPHHSREKDVVLAITLKLKQLIDRQPGMRAVLTRSGDYYVGLRKRLNIARKYNGDIFVSIHADAYHNPHSNGASVFALSASGATSEAARWIAEKENYSELGGVNLGDLDDINGIVRTVLIDLSQTATINASLQMGGRVLGQLNNFTRLHNAKVEQARFVVLKSPDMPSILVETGFISNPIEEKNLTNSRYQMRLGQAIFQGIKGYFWENPPAGSRIEAMVGGHLHYVSAGETLPSIAKHYHVALHSLKTINHLPLDAKIQTGQKLVIPSSWA